MAQGRDTARHILGLGQAAIGISLASNFHDLLVAGDPAGQNNPLASQGPLDRTVPGIAA